MDPIFEVHKLNDQGIEKARSLATCFDDLLKDVNTLLDPVNSKPNGREYSVVKTKLEEACFFAKKAIANQKENQL